MSSLFFVQTTFDQDGENGFVWRGRCKDWGAIAPQVSVSKKNYFKTNTGYFSALDLTQIFELTFHQFAHSTVRCVF